MGWLGEEGSLRSTRRMVISLYLGQPASVQVNLAV
jgi:hypothetical protein